jgi:putative tryptophan/tyrosine transport system substrate-binding protein
LKGEAVFDRRTFLMAGAGLFAGAARGQGSAADRHYTIGVLRPTGRPIGNDALRTELLLATALGQRGYVEGRNLTIETRYADGDLTRMPALARELVQRRVDVIVAVAQSGVRAAMDATRTIPILIWGNFDPVALGFVQSLSRPGGNVTGVLITADGTLAGKKLELLKQAAPGARRVAVLGPDDPATLREQLPELKRVAPALGVELPVVSVRKRDYARAFDALVAERAQALFVAASTYFVSDRKPIIELALHHRLPSIWEWREQAEDGGLMAYGASLVARVQQIADHVDRILRGVKPADIPLDRPTHQELTINLRTARSIGLVVPPALTLLASHVIE